MSQCRDHHDIIIYPLINKEFLIKKFPNQLTLISFCLLLTSALDLAASHYTEIRNLQKDLERLSSLSVKLNNWYTKYTRLRDICLQLRGHMAYLRRMHAHDIEVLENQVEQLQEAWRFLDDQLLERSREFNFIAHRWNPFDRH